MLLQRRFLISSRRVLDYLKTNNIVTILWLVWWIFPGRDTNSNSCAHSEAFARSRFSFSSANARRETALRDMQTRNRWRNRSWTAVWHADSLNVRLRTRRMLFMLFLCCFVMRIRLLARLSRAEDAAKRNMRNCFQQSLEPCKMKTNILAAVSHTFYADQVSLHFSKLLEDMCK